jgi:hypothetical protein
VTSVLGYLSDQVQHYPPCRPAGAGLKPGRRRQWLGGIEVGQVRHKFIGLARDLCVVLQQAGSVQS